jgi:addiction module RelB/DinJ family antitoxin
METTLTVRLDQKLKDQSEKTLNKLGLTTAAAVRVFLTQVVEKQGLPFPVETGNLPPYRAPIEFEYEILRELMSTCLASLFRMQDLVTNPKEIKKYTVRIEAIMVHMDTMKVDEKSVEKDLDQYSKLAGALRIQEEKLHENAAAAA